MLDRLATLRDKRDRDGGFTLIELLVVVVIIGILIAIAIPLYLNYKKGANDKAAMSDLRGAISALEQCNSDNSKYPAGMDSTGAMNTTDCAQKVTASPGTKFYYWAAADQSNYLITSSNSAGTTNSSGTPSKFFCYASASGGSVVAISANKAGYAASC